MLFNKKLLFMLRAVAAYAICGLSLIHIFALAEVVRAKAGNLLHWRQISVLAEALILIAVSFFPTALKMCIRDSLITMRIHQNV